MTIMGKTASRILIVDDSKFNREVLCDILGEEFDIVEAENGEEALDIIEADREALSLILLDINMPKLNGIKVLEILEYRGWLSELPVIVISGDRSHSTLEKCYELGATDYIIRPFDDFVVKRRTINTIMLYAKQHRLEEMVIEQIYQNERDNRELIQILSHIVEFRNGESGEHILNINVLTSMLLKELNHMTDKYHFSIDDITLISTASAMHDIGKISTPEDILNKPGPLTQKEFEIIKQHSLLGAEMIKSAGAFGSERLIREAYNICRWHHERYDGGGYPDGLEGDDIPISAQVVSIADVYDALTSERCYKEAYAQEKALAMIFGGQCGEFNPLLIECLKRIAPHIKERLYKDKDNPDKRDKIAIRAMDIFKETKVKNIN